MDPFLATKHAWLLRAFINRLVWTLMKCSASIVKPPTVRIVLSLAAQHQWSLRQLDISNAFLHGFLKEDVYMIQPPGFVDPTHPDHVCKLQKSLYGLKQAPRACSSAVTSLITQLAHTFKLKDLGPLRFFLGLHIDYNRAGLFVHQKKYVSDLLLNLVGALQYATFTRPDITYAVNQGTLHLGIRFQSGSSSLTAFTDSDWAGDPYDRRSTTGITVFLGAAELAWLRQVLCDLGVYLPTAPTMWCDNTSAIALASNPVFHSRTKHIEVDYHFIRERVVHGDLHLHFISTEDQLG
uniref:Reverse transcriptase Ty1/copia-type domain-containing protein n=1 Tax=Fagus sylvatica TaxID=28930 RepID=A0A2N9EIU9_FAGSY